MTNPTPDQSRTPELPAPVAWMSKSYCPWLNGGFAWVFSTCTVRPREESAPLYTEDQLREYGRACVAAAMAAPEFKVGDRIVWTSDYGDEFHGVVTEVSDAISADLDNRVAKIEKFSSRYFRHETASPAPDVHPESVCGSCKGENPGPWSAPNDLWNQIVGSPYGILCPNCFINLANEMGVTNVWDVAPRITPPDVQEAEPVADDWYTLESGSIAVDWDHDLSRQLSIILKKDGSVAYAANVNGKKMHGPNAMTPEFYDVLRELVAPSCDAEDARRFRALLDAMFDNNDGQWRIFWQAICRARTRDTYIKAIDAAMLVRGDGK